jgi:hypothetical protein
MTKLDSFNMAAKVLNNLVRYLEGKTRSERFEEHRRCDFDALEKRLECVSYPPVGGCISDTSSWSDSAGDTIFFRTGDYFAVSYWTGEDIVSIYEVSADRDLCESIASEDPVFTLSI